MVYCDAECQFCKQTFEGESVCSTEPVLSVYTANRLRCSSFKERSGPIEELHPGRKPDGLFPGQLPYKET